MGRANQLSHQSINQSFNFWKVQSTIILWQAVVAYFAEIWYIGEQGSAEAAKCYNLISVKSKMTDCVQIAFTSDTLRIRPVIFTGMRSLKSGLCFRPLQSNLSSSHYITWRRRKQASRASIS